MHNADNTSASGRNAAERRTSREEDELFCVLQFDPLISWGHNSEKAQSSALKAKNVVDDDVKKWSVNPAYIVA